MSADTEIADSLLIHDFMELSHANGPGARAVLWVQGCSLGCPGCFNTATHSREDGKWISAETLFGRITRIASELEGVTVSGGEPLEQARPLAVLLSSLRRETELSVIILTGYTWEEAVTSADTREVLALADVVIAGRYDHRCRLARGLKGSANKSVHFMTHRYSAEDLEAVPVSEVVVDEEGEISISGIDPPTMARAL